jgi:hypothetical protein
MHMGKRRSPKAKHGGDRIMDPEHTFFLVVKEEYRGKITYQEGDFIDEEPQEYVSTGVILEYCDN